MVESNEKKLTYKEKYRVEGLPSFPREWQIMILIGFFTILIKLAFTSDSNDIYYAVGFGVIAGINALGCALSWDDDKKERIIGNSLAVFSYIAFLALMYFVITL